MCLVMPITCCSRKFHQGRTARRPRPPDGYDYERRAAAGVGVGLDKPEVPSGNVADGVELYAWAWALRSEESEFEPAAKGACAVIKHAPA